MSKDALISAEERAFLESEILKLPDAELYFHPTYSTIIQTHAVPIVAFLLRLSESSITRTNLTVAQYATERDGNEMLYSRAYRRELQCAISDLGKAVGLNIIIDNETYDKSIQYPEELIYQLENAKFPPEITSRIEENLSAIKARIANQIRQREDELRASKESDSAKFIRNLKLAVKNILSKKRSKKTEMVVEEKPIDFIIKVSRDLDEQSYTADFQSDKHSYKRLNNKISIVPQV